MDDVDGDGKISFDEFYQSLLYVQKPQYDSFFREDGSVRWFTLFVTMMSMDQDIWSGRNRLISLSTMVP